MTSHSAICRSTEEIVIINIGVACGDARIICQLTLLDTVGILFRVTKRLDIDLVCLVNLSSSAVTDEDWLSSPSNQIALD